MIKWILYVVMACVVGGTWMIYLNSGSAIKEKTEEVRKLQEIGDPDGKITALESVIQTLSGQQTFNGILLAIVTAGVIGVFFVLHILPNCVQRVTHAIYDSSEMVDRDFMHDARSLMAQGDYQGAIEAFREAAKADPLNRLPWVEIAKIYKSHLGDPGSAVKTIRLALESQEWEVNDAAYFLFRLAELYDEVEGNRPAAVAIMQQVIDQFPMTRHSANANHKLHDWGMDKYLGANNQG
ncbi:MAG: hypothetical protein RLZZ282_367 [Verrucomicrobiota bacterium]